MPEAAAALKWGVERRLEFIEFRLYWEGGVNRSDIIGAFDVSVPQASKDLTLYQERAPQNAVYDKSAKRYIASSEFQPCFLKPDAGQYLNQLRSVAERRLRLGYILAELGRRASVKASTGPELERFVVDQLIDLHHLEVCVRLHRRASGDRVVPRLVGTVGLARAFGDVLWDRLCGSATLIDEVSMSSGNPLE